MSRNWFTLPRFRVLAVLCLALTAAACSLARPGASPVPGSSSTTSPLQPTTLMPTGMAAPALAWLNLPLTDARTGDTLILADHRDHTILLEMMDPKCYVCQTQIKEINAAREAGDGNAMPVFVAIDFRNDPAQLVAYADRLEADWPFAVATEAFVRALVADYGSIVVSSGTTPVIVIGRTGLPLLTESGIKRSEVIVDLLVLVGGSPSGFAARYPPANPAAKLGANFRPRALETIQ